MQKFSINHIKSFEDSSDIQMKPITILVGKNSCGKSSLLRFPVVLAQTFREEAITPLLLFGNLIDYGNYDAVAYRHQGKPLGFKLAFGPELNQFMHSDTWEQGLTECPDVYQDDDNFQAELQVSVIKPLKKLEVEEIALYLNSRHICTLGRKSAGCYKVRIHQLYGKRGWKSWDSEFEVDGVQFRKFIPLLDARDLSAQMAAGRGMVRKGGKRVTEMGYYFSLTEYSEFNIYKKYQAEFEQFYKTVLLISAYFGSIRHQLEYDTAGLAYIGPFRENPKRIYRESESSYNDVGVNGENTSILLRQAAQGDGKLLEAVSGWLKEAMGYTLDVREDGSGLYSLVVHDNEETDNIMDVGYGISQVLPIVTQLFNGNNSSYRETLHPGGTAKRRTVILEQPELHLHPAAQAQLADLFVGCIVNQTDMVDRILVETHSEHLIRKLQVLIADPDIDIKSEQVAIYYVDKDENGDSYAEEMKLCDNGQFEKAWPPGFFDKSYELTRLLMKAGTRIPQQGESYA